ncbi:acyl-CoA dehydrogenase family protein [Ureibacillus manganicus]|nr:hypothetical protein [Ureibacillus manganicus]
MFTVDEIRKIKSLSRPMEESKTILPEILDIIYEHKLFKIFTPKALGGLELSLIDGLKTFQQVGAIDGNIGWAVTIGSGGNMFVPLFGREVCKERFIHKDAVIAGSGKFGVAKKVDGGYEISGQWKYCSGADYATLFTMNCKLEGSGEIVTCSVPRETVEIIPDWNAIGLKATASHSMKVENTFVKEEDTFEFDLFKNEYELPVHRFPFTSFSESSFFSLCLGLMEQLITEANTALNQKREGLVSERYELVKEILNHIQSQLQRVEENFYSLVAKLWEKHTNGEVLHTIDLEELTTFCKEHSSELVSMALTLIRYFGMDAVIETTSLNRAWRNLCTASQHAFLAP